MLRRGQSKRADSRETRTYYISESWFRWLYVEDGRTWHVYGSDGARIQDQRALLERTRAELKEISGRG
jgi:hypothetical protein